MEWLAPVLGGLSQLAFVGLIVWVIVRLTGRRGERTKSADQAGSVRRLFVYGLMFVTLVLTAVGGTIALQHLIEAGSTTGDDASTPLALGLAFVIVAAPTYGLLLRYARGKLSESRTERESFSWFAYLNLSLIVSLIVTTASAVGLLAGVIGVAGFEPRSAIPVLIWGSIWAMHWFRLKAHYGLPGDVHLAAGSLTGLVTAAIGIGGLVVVAGDEIYQALVETVPVGHREPEAATFAAATAVGGLVWAWHWLRRYRRAPRTDLWHVYVVLIGALGGLLAALAAAATAGYWTLVWFVGDPAATFASEHFEYLSVGVAILLVGAISWQYHSYVLRHGPDLARTEPVRTYDYLMAGAGLGAVIVGLTLALVALLEAITPEPTGAATEIANRVLLAITLIAIGTPLWWSFWSRIRSHLAADPAGELGSAVRRVYLVVLFGLGGIVVLGSLISILFITLEDLLEGTLGGETIRAFRVGLALVLTVTGTAWYHLRVFRSDRDAVAAMEPPLLHTEPTPPHHVLLIAPRHTIQADELAAATHTDLQTWYRTDHPTVPAVDLNELAAEITALDAEDTLVVIGPKGPIVVPYETDPAHSHNDGDYPTRAA